MTRILYRWLIGWHPPAFRRRFEQEFLWIFEEFRETSDAAPLPYDAAISLLGQWFYGGNVKVGTRRYSRSGDAPRRIRKLSLGLAYWSVAQNL